MSVSPQSIEGVPHRSPCRRGHAEGRSGREVRAVPPVRHQSAEFLRSPVARCLGRADSPGISLERYRTGISGHHVSPSMYAFVGLPFGALSDKWYRNRLIALGTAFWSLLTAATGIAQNYAQIVHRAAGGRHRRGHLRSGRPVADRRFVSAESTGQGHGRIHARLAGGYFPRLLSAPAPSAPRSAGAQLFGLPAFPD